MEVRVKVLFCCTAQGCPLSPALFVLFIEQLAQAIREYRDTTGIPVRETEYKIFLYADDGLTTLTVQDLKRWDFVTSEHAFVCLFFPLNLAAWPLMPCNLTTMHIWCWTASLRTYVFMCLFLWVLKLDTKKRNIQTNNTLKLYTLCGSLSICLSHHVFDECVRMFESVVAVHVAITKKPPAFESFCM